MKATDQRKQTKHGGRAVVYARSASSHPADRINIERQVARCRRLANELDVEVVRTFVDAGVSGLRHRRPGLQQLLIFVTANPFDYVVCTDAVRLSRDYRHFDCLLRRLTACGLRLLTVDKILAQEQVAPVAGRGPQQ